MVDTGKNFLSDEKILKCIASGLRSNREKDQELVGHPVDWKEYGLRSWKGLVQASFRHLVALRNSGSVFVICSMGLIVPGSWS